MKDAEETSDTHFYEIPHEVKEVVRNNVIKEEKFSFNENVIDKEKEKGGIESDEFTETDRNSAEERALQTMEMTPSEPETLVSTDGSIDDEKGCIHHDMADSPHHIMQQETDNDVTSREQCTHSDAMKLGKAVKVNRVSPFRYGDIDCDNLLIDLTDSEFVELKRNVSQFHLEKGGKLKGKEQDECNGFVSDDMNISQERYATDLPRHNWLVKRLKQQNQLNEGDIATLHAAVTEGAENKKEGKKISNNEGESQPAMQSPNSPQQNYDSKPSLDSKGNIHGALRPLSPLSMNHPPKSPTKKDNTASHSPMKSAAQESSLPCSSPKGYTASNGPTTPRSPLISYMGSSSSSSSSASLSSSSLSSPTKEVTVAGLKPKLVMSTTLQQAVSTSKDYPPTLPGIDLSSLKYDSLSRFHPSPKQPIQQFYTNVSATYSFQQYSEGRGLREVTRPVPLHLKDNYKSEQDAFGLNHRVRLSFAPLSTTKDKMTFRNQNMDKSTSLMKSYETAYPASNPKSPEELKRTVAIQRQLENQKRWIAEHEPYKINSVSNVNKYSDHGEPQANQSVTSPLNPPSIPPPRYPSHEDNSNYNLDHLTLLQSREHLREKIDVCNKEIKSIQQQKDMLFAQQQGIPNTDSPTHLRIIALNRKLSSLEDYRMKQSALLMKLEAQPFDHRSSRDPRDQRSHAPLRKPSYAEVNVNGGHSEADDAPGKQRMNFSDLSDNMLLRQLQSKHDEGVSMVTTDSYCRTIDLSKTSEMFYNDMRMESLPMSQPSTPMSSVPLKDYVHSAEVPPLVSAERLSQANGLSQEKQSLSSGDYPRGHPLPYSKSPDVPRPISLSHSSRIPDNQNSHDIIHTYKSVDSSMSRDISLSRDQSRYSQYEKLARARELQHSLQAQEGPRGPHDITQIQTDRHFRARSMNPQEVSNGRPETVNQQDISKPRDISYPQHQGTPVDPTQNPYSPGALPHNQPYPDSPYEDARSKEISMKRHSNEPVRPGQLKLARTTANIMHQLHGSQMDRKYQKVLQHNVMENKYSPSNMPSMMGEENPYKRNARYEMISHNLPTSISDYDNSMSQNNARLSYPPEKQKCRIRTCNACDKESQFLCSGCRGIWYCSRECQLDDWKVHSKSCRKK